MDEISLLRELDEDLAAPDPAVRQAARAALDHHMAAAARTQSTTSGRARLVRRLQPRLAIPTAAALVLLVVLLAGGLPGGGSSTALAATPPALLTADDPGTPARPALLRLAATADAQPALAEGRYRHLKTASWYLHTAVTTGEGRSVVIPTVTETWIAGDGSGVAIEGRGEPLEAGPPDPHADRRSTDALPDDEGQVTRFGPGERHVLPTESLPRQPAALRAALLTDNAGVPAHAQLFVALTDRLVQQRLDPALVAAFYRVLADDPAMRSFGAITDRAGRRGVAVGFDSDYSGLPTRSVLIVDPHTGTPLGYEQILTTDPGKLNVRIPAVVGYATFLIGGPVDSTDQRGATIP